MLSPEVVQTTDIPSFSEFVLNRFKPEGELPGGYEDAANFLYAVEVGHALEGDTFIADMADTEPDDLDRRIIFYRSETARALNHASTRIAEGDQAYIDMLGSLNVSYEDYARDNDIGELFLDWPNDPSDERWHDANEIREYFIWATERFSDLKPFILRELDATDFRDRNISVSTTPEQEAELRGLIGLTAFRNNVVLTFDGELSGQEAADVSYTRPVTVRPGETVDMFTTDSVKEFAETRGYGVGANRLAAAFDSLVFYSREDEFPFYHDEVVSFQKPIKTLSGMVPEQMGHALTNYRAFDGSYLGPGTRVGDGIMRVFEHLYVEHSVITKGVVPERIEKSRQA